MAKRFLDELRWHPKRSIKGVTISYLHRGAPGDRATVMAEEVVRFERSFFVYEKEGREVSIPYHRIREVKRGDEVIWRRPTS